MAVCRATARLPRSQRSFDEQPAHPPHSSDPVRPPRRNPRRPRAARQRHDLRGKVVIDAGPRQNAIVIVDNGTGQVGNLTVTVDGKTQVPPVAADAIRITTGAGNDFVSYRLAGNMTGKAMDITTNLGPGNNRFRAAIAADLRAGARLEFSTRGGAGGDLIQLNALADVDLAATASLGFSAAGNGGRDRISTTYRGRLDGTLFQSLSGNQGEDNLFSLVVLDQGSRGTFVANQFGGADDDDLGVVLGQPVAAPSGGIIDGGSGFNRSTQSAGIQVSDVQQSFTLL
jgi:hypothetical protein